MMEDDDSLSLFGEGDDSIMDLIDQGNGYGEEYVSSPLTKTLINCPSVRVCKINTAEAVVGMVLLSKLTCNHTHNKCNCRTLNCDWMLNSRATVHISPYMANFIDYVPALVKGHVCTAEGPTDLVVEGSGMVLIQHVFHYKGKSHKELLRLQEVLYIPGVIAHFTSLVCLLKEGLRVYGDAAGMNLFTRENDKVPLMCAEPWDSEMLFWLKAEQPSLNGVESVFTTDYDLLHRRRGHPSKDMQKQTQQHTAGLPDVKIPCKMPICPGCALGKMSQQPFTSLGKRATHPLDKIHSDLKSFPIESYHRWKYFISFIDDNTSFAWVQFLCNKASAVSALRNFLAMIKSQYGKTIKEWMSDAGGEYKSAAFLKALKEQGIKVLQSAPHTPQQNGHTEHFNHTIMDKAEAMQHEACLSDSWWEFAVEQAVHLYNHTSMARLNHETPFYRMEGGIPDMSHLKVFRCATYVFLPSEIRKDKLSPKSELMTYLGIEQGLKVHRFMRSSNRLFYAPKALFDEEYFPWCKTQSQRRTTCLNKPINEQPRHQEIDDTAPPAPLPANPWDNLDGYRPNPPIPPRPSQPAPRPPATPQKPTRQAGIPTPPLQWMRPGSALDSPPSLQMQLNPAPLRGSGL